MKAALHKQKTHTHHVVHSESPTALHTEVVTVTPPEHIKPVVQKEHALSDEEKNINKYFVHDFRKSIIIITFIILVEIGLYFASHAGYLSKIIKL